ncbi:ABC-three component system middle component 6 [Streptococcus salivarius]|jgi:hypothetical protein|uniref:ABC-three component system middle component 6 n=1 Tax=Streptococcus salivarius TaxID=1304 RepID=UPI001D053818|nr:ABC-three component system middle component 6 [Streptococcus salivarius]MCB5542228.1 hypothetical protein [Streptococcus salivarius]
MLLLDKNAEPHKTVFYLSSMVYGIMLKGNLNIDSIYQDLRNELKDTLNYDFFILALDFLFLLDKIVVNRRGELEIVY